MATKGSSSASGDVLVLNIDGTVVLGWGKVSATLRRPTVGEWLSFMEEAEAADAWARGEDGDAEEPTARKTITDALNGGPFLAFYQRMLAELGDTTVETTDLPPWLALGDTMQRISNWWVSSPLSRSEAAAATRTLNP